MVVYYGVVHVPLSLLFYITVCYDYDSTFVLAVRVPASVYLCQ